MRHLIRTEWLKLATTRGTWATVLGVLALTALITPIAMADAGQGDRTVAQDALEALSIGPGFITVLVLLILGALGAAGEFRHRTIVATYLITPRRGRVLAAKLIAHATLGAAVAGLAVTIAFPIVLVMASRDGVHIATGAHLVGVAAAIVAAGAVASVCGVAVGSILRNQTTAIIVILIWTLLVEQFFGGFFPPVLPFGAILAAVGMGSDNGPGVLGSFAVISGWACVLVVTAGALRKRDVA
jgi:ABC-2 type transport system permease protein